MDANLSLWQSLALAAVQGITEFLPVSSSGHLVLIRRIFGWSDQGGLVFDTILHGGSLAAILIYFWREWVAIIRAYFPGNAVLIENPPPWADPPLAEKSPAEGGSAAGGKIASTDGVFYRRLPWLVAIATVPVVMAGPVLKPLLESDETIRNVSITGLSMIMTALLFLLAERRKPAAEKPVGFLNALFIGGMQIIALLPGASRSGWTTAGGIFCGQRRENAVRFAFLMAVPAIAGAMIFEAKDIFSSPQSGINPVLVLASFAVSFIVSLGAIHFCIKYFRSHSLRPFAIYLLLVGLISLLLN